MKYSASIPATTANIGAGFDVMGIALNIYNVFEVEENEGGLEFDGFKKEYCNENNIFFKSMIDLLKKFNYKYKGFKISLKEEKIPIARGLGSSSSCIVGGLLIANMILGNKLSKVDLLKEAIAIEGHPDNVAPAILGGLVLTVVEEDKLYYNKVEISEDIVFSSYIPNFKVTTESARNILPKSIELKDGIYNVSHAMLTLAAFINKDYDLLKIACRDKFHEQYRGALIKNYEYIKEKFEECGALCSFISGSGPTIIGLFTKESFNEINDFNKELLNTEEKFELLNLLVDNRGAQVEER